MINRITLQGVTSYSGDTPQVIDNLNKINCFYGLNGSGKSTIAKYLQSPAEPGYSSCSTTPTLGTEVFVYNQKFVKDNFWDSKELPGVFTVNEDNVEAERAIENAQVQIKVLEASQKDLEKKADGIKKRKALEQTNLENKVWIEKDKFVKTPLEFCLDRKQRKNLFLDAIREAGVASDDVTIEKLTFQAEELEKPDVSPKQLLPLVSFDGASIETDSINTEIIIGSSSSYLSSLIEKVGHSDWVREGLTHYEKSEGVCPFCQETPVEAFESSLKALFDEAYKQKCEQITSNRKTYQRAIESIENTLSKAVFGDEYVVEDMAFSIAKSEFLDHCRNNLTLLINKEEKPSSTLILNESTLLLQKLNKCIEALNQKISEFNLRVTSKPKIKEKIKCQFWQVHKRTYKAAIEIVDEQLQRLDEELESLRVEYGKTIEAIQEQQEVISSQRNKTTNIEASIQNIKNTLLSIGVDDFYIEKVDGEKTRYKITRKGCASEDVYETLSEGEKTLVTFLYFLEQCKGLLEPNSPLGLADKIIVIDDPVSSLSHNFVYEIAILIQKEIINKSFKQVFLFTHNLFFFHEMMNQSGLKQDEFKESYSLYRVRKDEFSSVVPIQRNDIRNEYDGYWQIIRDAKGDKICSPLLPNAMRNVLEHFFSFIHKKDKLGNILSSLGDQHNNFRPLLRYLNRGSHSDMVNLTDYGDIDVDRFIKAFKQVFVLADYEEHYTRMMKS